MINRSLRCLSKCNRRFNLSQRRCVDHHWNRTIEQPQPSIPTADRLATSRRSWRGLQRNAPSVQTASLTPQGSCLTHTRPAHMHACICLQSHISQVIRLASSRAERPAHQSTGGRHNATKTTVGAIHRNQFTIRIERRNGSHIRD